MAEQLFINLSSRGILKITGPEKIDFLQNIITVDINELSDSKALFSCLLLPTGKILADFFIILFQDNIYLDCHKEVLITLKKQLLELVLEKEVEIEDNTPIFDVYSILGQGIFEDFFGDKIISSGKVRSTDYGAIYLDPRNQTMQLRSLFFKDQISEKELSEMGFTKGEEEDYSILKILNSIAEVGPDIPINQVYPLDYNYDNMGAITFNKGCYIGQENVYSMKFKTKTRKKRSLFIASIPTISLNKQQEAAKSNISSKNYLFDKNDRKIGKVIIVSLKENIALIHMMEEDGKSAYESATLLYVKTTSNKNTNVTVPIYITSEELTYRNQ